MCEEDGRYKCSFLLCSVMPYVVYMWEKYRKSKEEPTESVCMETGSNVL